MKQFLKGVMEWKAQGVLQFVELQSGLINRILRIEERFFVRCVDVEDVLHVQQAPFAVLQANQFFLVSHFSCRLLFPYRKADLGYIVRVKGILQKIFRPPKTAAHARRTPTQAKRSSRRRSPSFRPTSFFW